MPTGRGRIVALIPVRWGSKGIPRKNLISIGDKPLIAHSILQARQSRHIDRVIVWSEDQEMRAKRRRSRGRTARRRSALPATSHGQNWSRGFASPRARVVFDRAHIALRDALQRALMQPTGASRCGQRQSQPLLSRADVRRF